MKKYIFYAANTGRITKLVDCAESDAPLNLELGENMIEAPKDTIVSDHSHYVDPKTQLIRYKEPLSGPREYRVSPEERIMIPLPELCLVAINGDIIDTFEVDDGTLELEFSAPGEYRVSFEMTHYTKQEVLIHVKED